MGKQILPQQLIIGLTGPMAAGKNAAANILSKKGYACVDADELAHEAIERAKTQILAYFKPQATKTTKDSKNTIELLNKDGTINRRALASLVFKSPENLRAQEAIIHPMVDVMINEFIDSHPNQPIVINATVLYKVPSINNCKFILFVTAPLFTRIKRVKTRDKHSVLHILQRFWTQRRLFSKYVSQNSDTYKVTNSGSLQNLEKNINKVLALQ